MSIDEPIGGNVKLYRERGPGTPWELHDAVIVLDAVGRHRGYATKIVDGWLAEAFFPDEKIVIVFNRR